MDQIRKLQTIAPQMVLEPDAEIGSGVKQARSKLILPNSADVGSTPSVAPCGIPLQQSKKRESLGVYDAAVSGRPMRLLKTMLTTACERNCHYCPFRAGRNYRRTTFKPEEMASTFIDLNRKRAVDGLFLSSGIIRGGVRTQDKLLDTVDILRNKHKFRGYIHLKVMPGAERDQVVRAMQLADRVSVNMEAPTVEHLRFLAPMKQLVDELLAPLRWADEIRRYQSPRGAWNGRWASTVTQFVVGAAQDTDLEYLKATDYLYNKIGLRRTYYSAFHPIRNTPLDNLPAENPVREHRLYQASFMLRDYGWQMEDLPFEQNGRLPLNVDPKLAWARQNLAHKPLELNRASKHEMLRVPGIGVKSAETIISARRKGKIRSLHHLRQLGVATKRLTDFVLLDGVQPAQQLRLF